jgi:transcriptional regulator with XRE-family HTH domain
VFVPRRLAVLRRRAGLSQEEVARRLSAALGRKVDRTAVGRIENGGRGIGFDEAIALAAAVGVPVTELVGTPLAANIEWLELHLRALEEDERQAQEKLRWATLARTDAEDALDALAALAEAASSTDPDLRRQLVPLALSCLRTAMPYLADAEALADAGLTSEQIEQVNQMRLEEEAEAFESQQPGAKEPE